MAKPPPMCVYRHSIGRIDMNNALKDLLLIDSSTKTEQFDKIYDSVFNKIANDHQNEISISCKN